MRPRKPRELKRITGGLRPDRDKPDPVPQDAGPLAKPSYLKGRPAVLFKEYAAICTWLDAADSRTLALFCDLLVGAEFGAGKMSPASIAQLRGLATDLGLTARTKERRRYMAEAPQEDELEDEEERKKREAVEQFFT